MKKFTTILTAILLALGVFAQTPQNMSYQAVIRNSENKLVANQSIGMQISIIQGSDDGEVVYTETQTAATNANGLVSIEIGAGESITKMSDTDWANGPFFIKTETDLNGGADYTIIAVSQLLSVPFAMHAQVAEKANSVDITGNEDAFANFDKDASDDFDGDYNSLTNKPEFTDTKLIETEVDAMVANNGYVTKDSVLTETQVDAMTANNGYLTSFTEVDGDVTNEIQALSISNDTVFLSNGGFVKLPTAFSGSYNDLSDKPDLSVYLDDTKLKESEVDAMVGNNGYLTNFTEVDGDATNEIQSISRSGLTVTLTNGGTFTDSVLTDANIAAMGYVKTDAYSKTETDAKYLTAEHDGDATNELQTISRTDLTVTLTNGGTFTDSVLTETEIDAFANNNGYAADADLHAVAKSGSYADLENIPTLWDSTYASIKNTPDLSVYTIDANLHAVAKNGSYTALSNRPDLTVYAVDANLHAVAKSGSYTNLSNTPDLSVYATKDMANANITNVADPISAQDAATKAYVDELKKIVEALVRNHNETGTVPVITTDGISEVTGTTATASANIISEGNSSISDCGFVWSTSQNPTTGTNEGSVSSGTSNGDYTGNMTGLNSSTTYYVRAYATNAGGTSYGNEVSFTTTPAIGDFFQGGVVFHVFTAGQTGYVEGEVHGLISAVSDAGYVMWNCAGMSTSAYRIGTGKKATADLMAQGAQTNSAASYCAYSQSNGFNDWFLPSQDALLLMHTNKATINATAIANGGSAFEDNYYWTALGTAYKDQAIRVNFTDGTSEYKGKTYASKVRPVRTF